MGNNVPVPSSTPVEYNIENGDDLVIEGQVTRSCTRFSINLCEGKTIQTSGHDVMLQFCPIFDSDKDGTYVVRSRRNAGWVGEKTYGGMPLRRGQSFTLRIRKESSTFKVCVDKTDLCAFHSHTSQNPKYVYVDGGLVIKNMSLSKMNCSQYFVQEIPPEVRVVNPQQNVKVTFSQPKSKPPVSQPKSNPPVSQPKSNPPVSQPKSNPPVSQPKSNPPKKEPFRRFITDGVKDGLNIVIEGNTMSDCDRFSIGLCCADNLDNGDVALLFKPRFKKGDVLRNHKQGGTWGAEETAGGLPFSKGKAHKIVVKVKENGYKVKVDKQLFCDFTHRIPVNIVHFLYIEGGFNVASVAFNYGKGPKGKHPTESAPPTYPSGPAAAPDYPAGLPAPGYPGYPPIGAALSYPGAPIAPIYNPPMPVTTPIQGGFYPGKIICITGTAHNGASRFQVKLACGYAETSDLAFYLDARFQFGQDRKLLVRTHKERGKYGVEERHCPYFPFSPGAKFEMMLLCEPQCIKVAVNNQHLLEFNHRIQPLQRIDHLQINGGVSVSQIRF